MELRGAAVGAQAELRSRLGREPSTAELASELDASEGDVALALDAAASQVVELQPDDAGTEDMGAAEDRLFLSDAVRSLDERERRVVYLRFVRDAEPEAIATGLGISKRQLARITDEALRKLRLELETPIGKVSVDLQEPKRREPKIPAAAPPARNERKIEQQYHIELVKSDNSDGWTAQVEELAGCTAHGATPQEAAAGVQTAISDWIAQAEAEGREIPKPRTASSYSGRLLVRMPQSLHGELARAAEREEISLNQFITSSLASAVRWRGSASDEPAGNDAPDDRSRNMSKALLANLLLLAVIAALALALLVIAVSRS
jgi:predicted HicB family RNase H-like nuclease